ncbi:MAG: BatD family protein [Verrucomicrobia bacterium]|nr:BatD family protein [Verrucomicrobiota bacterium]MDA1068152.1 BatD family protein [Verrucomicrobiota bacterium]
MNGLHIIRIAQKPSLLLLAALCLFGSILQAQVQAIAILEPNPVPLGQSAQLNIIIEGSQKAEPPEVRNNQNLEFAYRGPNTQVSWVNGKMAATITHVYQVRPLRLGRSVIGPFVLFVDGKNYKTNEIKVDVVEQAEAALDLSKIAYLEFDLPGRNVYVGETISSELRMVLLSNATFPTKGLPQIEGDAFSITPIDNQPQTTRVVSDGNYYDVYLWKIGITPVKSGVQNLQFKANHVLRIPEGRNNNRRDSFSILRNDPFFDSMFGRYRDTEILAMSPPAEIRIDALPQDNKPESFNGAIGTFNIAATTDSTNLSEGDPITLKIAIKGEGNFSQMIPPEFPANDSFKTYPPRVVDEQLDAQGYTGSKQFEYVVIPLSSEISAVPPIAFSYFNPRTKTYAEMNTPPIPITIKARSAPQPGTNDPQFNATQLTFRSHTNNSGDLLLPIKVSLGSTMTPPTLSKMQNTLAASVIAPLGILGLAYIIRRSRHSSQNDKERIRLRELDQKTAMHRKEMVKARSSNDEAAFYQAACRVLQVALARQLGCNPEAITGKEITALWVPSLGDDQIKNSIEIFFQKVDALRYSGGANSAGALEKEELELESILRQLGKKK